MWAPTRRWVWHSACPHGSIPPVEWTDNDERGVSTPLCSSACEETTANSRFALHSTDAKAIADLRDSPPGLGAQATVSLTPKSAPGWSSVGDYGQGVSRPAGDISHVVPGATGPICPVCGHACLNATMMPLTIDHSARAQTRAAQALGTVMARSLPPWNLGR